MVSSLVADVDVSEESILQKLQNSSATSFNQKSFIPDISVTSDELLAPALIYSGVALVYFLFLNRFNGFFKEVVFFSLLALVVTSSVQLAGVLVVFEGYSDKEQIIYAIISP